MYLFGQILSEDVHFLDHMEHGIPIQVYMQNKHIDVGFILGITREFIKVDGYYYSRKIFTFVSRPGY